ncbi:MAG: GMC family oxidoreductase, partial [Acidobacteriota bacterium]
PNDARPELQLDDPHPFLGRSVMDHYFLPPGVSNLAKGGLLRFGLGQPAPVAQAQRLARRNGLAWGQGLKDRLRSHFGRHRRLELEVFHDYLPNSGTRMVLSDRRVDAFGFPVAHLDLDPDPHHRTAGAWLQRQGIRVFEALGADDIRLGPPGDNAGYLVHGTCRAGDDPATSVLDRWCRSHEVPNLFVVDGAFMPTSGGAPPTLTILANSFRVARHLTAALGSGDQELASP